MKYKLVDRTNGQNIRESDDIEPLLAYLKSVFDDQGRLGVTNFILTQWDDGEIVEKLIGKALVERAGGTW